jgi:PAS domain S-box-containing protein
MTKPSSVADQQRPFPAGNLPSGSDCTCRVADHFVQFYDRDEFLTTSVGRFVLHGLRNQSNALVIASAEHLDGIRRELREGGVDPDEMIQQGRYLQLTATDVLREIMVTDAPSPALFEQHVGSLVARLTSDGQRLCAFGEMVAQLWADGNRNAAIQLEELWNTLSEQHAFSLFCAYPMNGFAGDSATQPFVEICRAHTRVLPTEEYPAAGTDPDERLRSVALLQQKAAALEAEVADRKRFEATLRRREAELTALVETASIGLHWVNADGQILWANKAEFGLLGYSAEEYIGHNIAEFHADRPVIAEILQCLSRGENIVSREAQLTCKDGTIKTVVIDSSVLWEEGQFVHTQCFTRDITDQRLSEVASGHLAAIVEGSDDAILSKNLRGIITSWNKGAERIFGYVADEVVGQPVTILIPPDRLNEETVILGRIRRGERVDHYETIRRCKDGALLDVSLTISPIRASSGKIIGASKIARDITEKKRSEKALRTAREELSRANEELERRVQEQTASLREAIAQLEEFSYTVSHDLRAPLRGMQVYSQALLEDYGPTLDAEAQHCLTRIAENATRLDRMVLDVLTFSRISRAELPMTRVHLDKLVRDIIQHYPAMQLPRAIIEVAQLHDVSGHEPSLTQVVSNLLSNSVKFVAPGVTPTVRVWTEQNANGVRLWIKDNGIGIKPERQTRLFKMFERVHPDLGYEGTGVGLAIVRKAANRMGGDVGVQSDGLTGTTFWVQLPAPGATA